MPRDHRKTHHRLENRLNPEENSSGQAKGVNKAGNASNCWVTDSTLLTMFIPSLFRSGNTKSGCEHSRIHHVVTALDRSLTSPLTHSAFPCACLHPWLQVHSVDLVSQYRHKCHYRIKTATPEGLYLLRHLVPLTSTAEDPEISNAAATAAIMTGPAIPREPPYPTQS